MISVIDYIYEDKENYSLLTVKEKSLQTPLYVDCFPVPCLKQLQLKMFNNKNDYNKISPRNYW